MSQPIRGQDGHLCFPIGPKNTKFVEDIEYLLFIKSFIKFQGFQRRSQKYEKLTTDRQGIMRYHNSALEPLVQVHKNGKFRKF